MYISKELLRLLNRQAKLTLKKLESNCDAIARGYDIDYQALICLRDGYKQHYDEECAEQIFVRDVLEAIRLKEIVGALKLAEEIVSEEYKELRRLASLNVKITITREEAASLFANFSVRQQRELMKNPSPEDRPPLRKQKGSNRYEYKLEELLEWMESRAIYV